ncbi:hypothetical protein B0H21DRAFT_846725, partial [Amylocystis lapponica]
MRPEIHNRIGCHGDCCTVHTVEPCRCHPSQVSTVARAHLSSANSGPLPVSDLKSSASKAKDFGAGKFSSARDRYSSPASKNLSWDTSKPPPPPPPLSRSSNSISRPKPQPPPPSHPISRSSTSIDHTRSQSSASEKQSHEPPRPPPPIRPRQDSASVSIRDSPEEPASNKVDWAHLTPDDKQLFFGWLDEYFSQRLGVAVPTRGMHGAVQHHAEPVVAPAPQRPPPPSVSSRASGPPSIPKWSKPAAPSPAPSTSAETDPPMSYPPPTVHGSAALDLAHYFAPSTHWDSAWYTADNPIPPPLQGSTDMTFVASWETSGPSKTLHAGVLFADLSTCWFSVSFSTTARAPPADTRAVPRSASFLPRPAPLPAPALRAAHATYGDTVAGFAESFAGGGAPCARGECWDLASEALRYVAQFAYVPAPVPSVARTHGHLLFAGRPAGGRWRGGDDRVRRGDVVEWRTARVVRGPGQWSTLGAPDHTAVVVADAEPAVGLVDGLWVRPAELGTLEVVEQSVGAPPERERYPLSGFEGGEIWIYRPVGMVEYVGALLEPQCPEGVDARSL